MLSSPGKGCVVIRVANGSDRDLVELLDVYGLPSFPIGPRPPEATTVVRGKSQKSDAVLYNTEPVSIGMTGFVLDPDGPHIPFTPVAHGYLVARCCPPR